MTVNLQALMLECSRCRHHWLRRTASEPRFCPGCKTRLWNKPRVRHIAPERRAGVRDDAEKARTTVAARAARKRSDARRRSVGKDSRRKAGAGIPAGGNRSGSVPAQRGSKKGGRK